MAIATTEGARSAFWWVRWVPAFALVVAVVALLLVVGHAVVLPLVLGFALAFMLEPVADWFQARGLGRNAAVLLALVTATVVTLVVLLVLLPRVWHQLGESVERFPAVVKASSVRLQGLVAYAKERLSPSAYARIQAAIEGFQNDPSAVTSHVEEWLAAGLFGLVDLGSAVVGLLIVPFFVYYLMLDMANIRRVVEEHIPERHRGVGAKLFDEIGDVVRGYVRGRFMLAICMAILYGFGLALLGVPVPGAIGLIAGLVGVIPYLGVTTGLILALGFSALDGGSLAQLVGVFGVFAVAQLIEDYVLTPRLIGDRLELHPMFVFIALIIAGDLFGLLGLVLAIPILGVLKVVVRFVDELYLTSSFYKAPALAGFGGETTVQRAAAVTVSKAAQDADARLADATREAVPQRAVSAPVVDSIAAVASSAARRKTERKRRGR